jgi:hypothetical protein
MAMKMKYIDEKQWRDALGKPNWYVLLADDFDRLEKLAEQHESEPSHKQIKGEAYAMIEEAVREKRLPLAASSENFDIERKPIDTIVIHHTKNPPGMTLDRLNAMQLLRIYGRYYANPTDEREKHLKGQPVWSGHFYEGQQVFWGYHWLVREDGTSNQILNDECIGWHAGNWDVNTRSIGICIDDDLSEKQPNEAALKAIATIIRKHYPRVSAENIVGHGDVNKRTVCPGALFHSNWRQKLLDVAY